MIFLRVLIWMIIALLALLLSLVLPLLYYYVFLTVERQGSPFDWSANWSFNLKLLNLHLALAALLLANYFAWRLIHPLLGLLLSALYMPVLFWALVTENYSVPTVFYTELICSADQTADADYSSSFSYAHFCYLNQLQFIDEQTISLQEGTDTLLLTKGVAMEHNYHYLLYAEDFTWGEGKRGVVIGSGEYPELPNTSALVVGSIFSTCGLLGLAVLWKRRKRQQV